MTSLFYDEMNGIHPSIKFIFESENLSKLPFLDKKIFRKDRKYFTAQYFKLTDTGLYPTPYSICDEKYLVVRKVLAVFMIFNLFLFSNEIVSVWFMFHCEQHDRLAENNIRTGATSLSVSYTHLTLPTIYSV